MVICYENYSITYLQVMFYKTIYLYFVTVNKSINQFSQNIEWKSSVNC